MCVLCYSKKKNAHILTTTLIHAQIATEKRKRSKCSGFRGWAGIKLIPLHELNRTKESRKKTKPGESNIPSMMGGTVEERRYTASRPQKQTREISYSREGNGNKNNAKKGRHKGTYLAWETKRTWLRQMIIHCRSYRRKSTKNGGWAIDIGS